MKDDRVLHHHSKVTGHAGVSGRDQLQNTFFATRQETQSSLHR